MGYQHADGWAAQDRRRGNNTEVWPGGRPVQGAMLAKKPSPELALQTNRFRRQMCGCGAMPYVHVLALQAFTTKDKNGKSSADQAKQLLTQYGSAYLITSISFALVSFTLCYLTVDAG